MNPYLKPWHELSQDQQQENIDFVSSYPAMLRENLKWGVTRDFVIGVTGHRLNKVDINNEALKQSIQQVLQRLVDGNPTARHTILSPLAEGSDRLVARIAMEQFGMELVVPLPLPYELYMEDFGTESLEEFKELIGKATRYYELPMRFGTLEDLGQRSSNETNELRNQQYALAGSYICERADELIAIYDGEPAAGTGGTADVVQWRKLGEVPDEYRNDASFFQRPLMRDPIILEPNP